MSKYYISTGKLSYCPFCGKKSSWHYSRELGFVNKATFECNHCDGRISINENNIKNQMAFDIYNEFEVDSTGKYNYGLLSLNSTYDVVTLIDKANFAHINSKKSFSNETTNENDLPTSKVVNSQTSSNNIHNQINEKSNKNIGGNKFKVVINLLIIIGGIFACFLIYFNFFK